MLTIYTDGASLGNPGPMGVGVVIYRGRMRIEELSEFIGEGTNNIAEYTAIMRALETARQLGENEVHVKSDSELVVRQMNGEYKVKDPKLRPLKRKIDSLCAGLEVHFEHIPREKNGEADRLSKEAAKRGRTHQTVL
ncbi:reverse transcriptase-like protein [Candidatus Micrarchaeota archaeon]|nr:reverse transcriptase-like protein [Candidatus Micrarchaeota archaeon]